MNVVVDLMGQSASIPDSVSFLEKIALSLKETTVVGRSNNFKFCVDKILLLALHE